MQSSAQQMLALIETLTLHSMLAQFPSIFKRAARMSLKLTVAIISAFAIGWLINELIFREIPERVPFETFTAHAGRGEIEQVALIGNRALFFLKPSSRALETAIPDGIDIASLVDSRVTLSRKNDDPYPGFATVVLINLVALPPLFLLIYILVFIPCIINLAWIERFSRR